MIPTSVSRSRVIQALRKLSADARPEHLYGCEVWRDLDWTIDEDKVVFDVEGHESLAVRAVGGVRFAD